MLIAVVAVLLIAIAAYEIFDIFFSLPKSRPPYVNVLPVFADDEDFAQRLDHLAQKGCGRRDLIIVDYSATPEQIELCKRFIDSSPDAVFISHADLKNFFAETFAFHQKI